MKKISFFTLLLFFNFYCGQKKTAKRLESILGIWENKESDYALKFEVSKNNGTNDFLFSLINFRNEKFIISKANIYENDNNAIIVEIEEAKLSDCTFNSGKIIVAIVTENKLLLNMKGVSKCWISEDTSIVMEDVQNSLLTKKQ